MNKSNRLKYSVPMILILWTWWIYQAREPKIYNDKELSSTQSRENKIKQIVSVKNSSLQKDDREILTDNVLTSALFTEEEIKTIRGRVKLNLSAAYTAEASYFNDFNRYTTDLKKSGIGLDDAPLRFKFGFIDPYYPHELQRGEDPMILDSDAIYNAQGSDIILAPSAKNIELDRLSKYCNNGCTASEAEFEIIAAVNLDSDPTLDIWLINEKKQIVHRVDDLKE